MAAPVNDPRFAQAMRRVFATKGPFSLDAEDAVVPTYELVAAMQPEWAFVRNERLWMERDVSVAAAGNLSYVWLVNPPGSATLCIVEHVLLELAATQLVRIGTLDSPTLDAAIGSGNGVASPQDMRVGPRPNGASTATPVCVTHDNNGGGLGAIFGGGPAYLNIQNPYANPWTAELDVPVILDPGSALLVQGGVVNTTVSAVFFIRERQLGEELT